jgi:hypothetical protein
VRYILLFFFISVLQVTNAQINFAVENFSTDYYAKVYIADTSEVFSPGWIVIFDKNTKQEIIKVESEELTYQVQLGKIQTNIHETPYGEQSLIIYEDFNFDGVSDLAIMDGQNSCYHGPSFKIYLANDSGFDFSPEFTRLSQEYCGMFEINTKEKKIKVMMKSGCCWHQYSEFILENNKPKVFRTVEEDLQYYPISIYTVEMPEGGQMLKNVVKTINLKDITVVLSFKIEQENKELILFESPLYESLGMVSLDMDKNMDFIGGSDLVFETPEFVFDSKKNVLSCTIAQKSYKIFDSRNKLSIEIQDGNKKYDFQGEVQTKKGALSDLLNTKFKNVLIK